MPPRHLPPSPSPSSSTPSSGTRRSLRLVGTSDLAAFPPNPGMPHDAPSLAASTSSEGTTHTIVSRRQFEELYASTTTTTCRGRLWLKYVNDQKALHNRVIEDPIVFVKLKVFSLSNVDLEHRNFEVDFVLLLDWVDRSTIDVPDPQIEAEHFSPYVFVDNSADKDYGRLTGGRVTARLQEREWDEREGKYLTPIPGHVKRTVRFNTKIRLENICMENYPFDSHNFTIRLKGDHCKISSASLCGNYKDNPRHVFEKCFHHYPTARIGHAQEWSLLGRPGGYDCFAADKYSELAAEAAGARQKYKDLEVTVRMQRNPLGVIKMHVFTLFVCVALSISSFYLEPDKLGERLTLTLTLLLAIAQFHQNAQKSVPKLPYQTKFDKYMFQLIFLCLAQAVAHVLIKLCPDSRQELLEKLRCPQAAGWDSASSFRTLLEVHPPVVYQGLKLRDFTPPPGGASDLPNAASIAQQVEESSHRVYAYRYFALLLLALLLRFLLSKSGGRRLTRRLSVGRLAASLGRLLGEILVWAARTAAGDVWLGPAFFFAGGYAVLGWSPERCGRALGDVVVAAWNAFAKGNFSGRTNPAMCNDDVLALFELFSSNSSLFCLILVFIMYYNFVFWFNSLSLLERRS